MSIDTGEGLRGIQPVTEVLRADIGYHHNPNVTQFENHLQECIRKQKVKGAEVLHKIKYGYDYLYAKHGIQPNAVMLSSDYLAAVMAECFNEYQCVDLKPDQLLGMDVIIVKGVETAKVCIIDKEE